MRNPYLRDGGGLRSSSVPPSSDVDDSDLDNSESDVGSITSSPAAFPPPQSRGPFKSFKDKSHKADQYIENNFLHGHRGNTMPSSALRSPAPPPMPTFPPAGVPAQPLFWRPPLAHMRATPLPSYNQEVSEPSNFIPNPAPKSQLLVLDLDNTLYCMLDHSGNVESRPFLKNFLDWVLHPNSPFNIALWSYSGRRWAIAHLHSTGLGDLFFEDNNPKEPLLTERVLGFWGYEDCGMSQTEMNQRAHPNVKDLDRMWNMINDHRPADAPLYGPHNSLIVDDSPENAACQPFSIIQAIRFFASADFGGPIDDFLIQLVGALDELSHQSNFSAFIKSKGWQKGIKPSDMDEYAEKGNRALSRWGIKRSRGKRAALSEVHPAVRNLATSPTIIGPAHDVPPLKTDRSGRVDVKDLRGCCQDPPHPAAVIQSGPDSDADGCLLFPNSMYEKIAAQPSRQMPEPKSPLVILDLDGTLFARPLCHFDPDGVALSRPYLKTFLTWLLRPGSPWTVAIWTTEHKERAVQSLTDLGLGNFVGPRLVGPEKNQVELLQPKLVAFWAREDMGLSPKDFHCYVRVTKDLDMMWEHLSSTGVGKWSAYDTVVLDNLATCLRGQPDSGIDCPTFYYPVNLHPSGSDPHDTFLLQMIAALDELSYESNFANFIHTQMWNEEKIIKKRQDEFLRKGLILAKKEYISIQIGSKGDIHVPPHERKLPFTIQGRIVAPAVGSSQSYANVLFSRAPQLNGPPTIVSRPVAADAVPSHDLRPITTRRFPVDISTSPARAPPSPPSSDDESDSASVDTADDSTEPRFVREEEALAALHGHPWAPGFKKTAPPRLLMDRAIHEWEKDSFDTDPRNLVQPLPYEMDRGSYNADAGAGLSDEEDAFQSLSQGGGRPPAQEIMSPVSTTSTTSDLDDPIDDSYQEPTFVREQEALAARHGHPFRSGRSRKQRLGDAVHEWESDPDFSSDDDVVQNQPYAQGRASYNPRY